jgi:5-methylthioribose kinase
MSAAPADSYQVLDRAALQALLARVPHMPERLGARAEHWQIREVGDGNLNLVFIVSGPAGAVCVKQALPYLRAAGPAWPMTAERAFFEHAYYAAVASHVPGLIPQVYHYEPSLYCTVMECLSPHIILRQGLIQARHYPRMARHLGDYIARACFHTSDLAVPFERKLQGMALFAGNRELIRISVDLIFTDPYRVSKRNRHTSPQLDAIAAGIRSDADLKLAAARFGHKFLTDSQALIHADLHSGSVMVTETDTRVIDPEFAFYGPIGFDLGALFGNLLLAWYAQSGHESEPNDRRDYQDWILAQLKVFWDSFRESFLMQWTRHAGGDAYPPSLFAATSDAPALQQARETFVQSLFADMLGFAACKMIRRIVGFAHVADFETIADADRRARCESAALSMARVLLTHPRQFTKLDDVVDAVPRVA